MPTDYKLAEIDAISGRAILVAGAARPRKNTISGNAA